jgi:cation transport regulator ChaB
MSDTQFIETLPDALQTIGARLLTIAMSKDQESRDALVKASEAVLIAARKVRKHTSDWTDLTE